MYVVSLTSTGTSTTLKMFCYPQISHVTVCVCVCVLCLYARVLSHLCRWLLLAVRDERREGKEGSCVSMTTHLLVALYKARRGGRERRANRY